MWYYVICDTKKYITTTTTLFAIYAVCVCGNKLDDSHTHTNIIVNGVRWKAMEFFIHCVHCALHKNVSAGINYPDIPIKIADPVRPWKHPKNEGSADVRQPIKLNTQPSKLGGALDVFRIVYLCIDNHLITEL